MFEPIARIALDIIFPPICIHCETYIEGRQGPLCASCYNAIARNTTLTCPICATRLANNRRACKHSKKAIARAPYVLGAATWYTDPIARTCIHACKYQGMHALTAPLAQLLVEYINALQPAPHIQKTAPIVVPIPLHSAKERKRGFNQSALLAQKFASALNLPYQELLLKQINNDAQAQVKTHTERIAHMRDAFVTTQPERIQNKNIIIIDDVSTSGATLAEAAQTLKAAGAKHILALVVAKA